MGFFEKVKNTLSSNELKSKKSHLRNLVTVAVADGSIHNNEHDFVLTVASSMYMSESDVRMVFQHPGDIPFHVPTTDREKIDQLFDLVKISLIDGEINKNEVHVCKMIAAKFGYRTAIIDSMFETIIAGIVQGLAEEIVIQNALKEVA